MDYSSKFSPWLALGCCSARSIAKKLTEYEIQYGANDGTYWLWFELLWRDYFRFLHFKYGKKLYQSRGLSTEPNNTFIEKKFIRWISGDTGESLVDAGMHELHATGYLSNRMRQIVASYWIYNMKGDWQAGAAWFESQLIDYDVYSNQGNWLYIAGKGTDPRGGRPMNVSKQTQDHDPEGIYRNMWLS
jgi:deoxyribodipyrimidine photo-lyase